MSTGDRRDQRVSGRETGVESASGSTSRGRHAWRTGRSPRRRGGESQRGEPERRVSRRCAGPFGAYGAARSPSFIGRRQSSHRLNESEVSCGAFLSRSLWNGPFSTSRRGAVRWWRNLDRHPSLARQDESADPGVGSIKRASLDVGDRHSGGARLPRPIRARSRLSTLRWDGPGRHRTSDEPNARG